MSNEKANVSAGTLENPTEAEALPDAAVEQAAGGGWPQFVRAPGWIGAMPKGHGSSSSPTTAADLPLAVGAGDYAGAGPVTSGGTSIGEILNKVVK